MILVVATMCLVDRPDACQQKEWLMAGEAAVVSACQLHPSPPMVKWLEDHPEFTVKAWSCRDPLKDL